MKIEVNSLYTNKDTYFYQTGQTAIFTLTVRYNSGTDKWTVQNVNVTLSGGAVKTFIQKFFIAVGGSYLSTDAYYQQWQAILNSKGTTSVKRQFGLKKPNGSIFWDTVYHYTQFESQKPVF